MKTIVFLAVNREEKEMGWAVNNALRNQDRRVIVLNPEDWTNPIDCQLDLLIIPDTGNVRDLPECYFRTLFQRVPVLVLSLSGRKQALWPQGTPVYVLERSTVDHPDSLNHKVENLLQGKQDFEERIEAFIHVAREYLGLKKEPFLQESHFLLSRSLNSHRKILIQFTAQPLELAHVFQLHQTRCNLRSMPLSSILLHKTALTKEGRKAFAWVGESFELSLYSLYTFGRAIAFQQL